MSPDPMHIAAWLASFGFLVMLVNQGLKLVDRLKEKPIPSETYATKTEVKEHKAQTANEHKDVTARLVHVEETLRREQREDTEKIFNKLNAVGETVAGLKVADEIQTQQLAAMDNKLTKLLNRASSSLP